jgi:hypothetical protein
MKPPVIRKWDRGHSNSKKNPTFCSKIGDDKKTAISPRPRRYNEIINRQVSWLKASNLLVMPSHHTKSGTVAPCDMIICSRLTFVAYYSSGAATDFHRFPYSPDWAPINYAKEQIDFIIHIMQKRSKYYFT